MVRLVFFLVAGALVFVWITNLSSWLFIVPAGLLAFWAYTGGGMKLRCSHCGKRIKVGYATCHHCGASFGPQPR